MSYVRYSSTRERSPYHDDNNDSFFSRPLVRRNSKRSRADIWDDDEYDDYPKYSTALVKPSTHSRALTIRRQPSQLQSMNVFNDRWNHDDDYDNYDDRHRSHRSRHVHRYYAAQPERSESDDEREFRLKVKATFSRPRSSHEDKPMIWSGDLFKRKEKWERVDYEERARRDNFWDDEKDIKYRKLKRTRTDEWKPLRGFGSRW